jgi:transposase
MEEKISQRPHPLYNKLPVKVSRKDFNRHIKPHLSEGKRGPDTKISSYRIFNHILYVLHTGIQWSELRTGGKIHWSNIYRHHNRWSKDGGYKNVFEASLAWLKNSGELDLSVLHGDGSNTVAKKGDKKQDIRGTNIKKERK